MESLLTQSEIQRFLTARPADGHKGSFGHLAVLAGSLGFTGAAKLVCNAANRSGVGLVTAGIPASLAPVLAASLCEPMYWPLPETDKATLAYAALDFMVPFLERKSALALGPGLSQHPETARLVRNLLASATLPIVADADGLNAFAAHPARLCVRESEVGTLNRIFTPHAGEMARITGLTIKDIQSRRIECACTYAARWHVVVVLKGAGTVIAAPDGRCRVCPTGNNGMATGGSGDVLTGIAGALLAQGMEVFEAACTAVYVHGWAGDRAAQEKGMRSLIAHDIIDALPDVWKQLDRKKT